jgi:hypothetical protein
MEADAKVKVAVRAVRMLVLAWDVLRRRVSEPLMVHVDTAGKFNR